MTSPRVLVVDDDAAVLRALERYLAGTCDVQCCADPREALKLARGRHFDVIVTDYQMPFMTGGELAREVHRAVSPPPYCVLLTGDPDAVKSSSPGAADLVLVLGKPFAPARLLRLVLEVGRLSLLRRGALPA